MKDQKNREVLTRIYRAVERFEETPKLNYSDEAEVYWMEVLNECKSIYDDFGGNAFAEQFAVGLLAALEERYKQANPDLLAERTPKAKQTSIFDRG